MSWIGLIAAIPLCFCYFYADYLGDYRVRSAVWFESNVRGALETVIDDAVKSDSPPQIFISKGMNQFIDWYWRFYLLKHRQAALETRTTYFDPHADAGDALPPNALVVAEAAARERVTAPAAEGLVERSRVLEPDGEVSFYVCATGPHQQPPR